MKCNRQTILANTSSNDIIKDLISSSGSATRSALETVMQGGQIKVQIVENLTYDMIKESEDSIWSFLLFTGYLKKHSDIIEDNVWSVNLVIPNREVAGIYETTFKTWFKDTVKHLDLTPFVTAMETGDCDAMVFFLNRQLGRMISYPDTAENFYHGFLLGLLGNMEHYELKSNREAGDGRPDIILMDTLHYKYGIIFELKVASKFKEMSPKCDEALRQIEDRHYDYDLEEDGYTHIQKYGICFFKKRCLVKTIATTAHI